MQGAVGLLAGLVRAGRPVDTLPVGTVAVGAGVDILDTTLEEAEADMVDIQVGIGKVAVQHLITVCIIPFPLQGARVGPCHIGRTMCLSQKCLGRCPTVRIMDRSAIVVWTTMDPSAIEIHTDP